MNQTTIEKILNDEYDVSVVSAPVEAIHWSIDRMSDKVLIKTELKIINRIRAKHGVIPVYEPYEPPHAF